jgi:NADH-quinone oxidoreductase subunit A
MTEIAMPLTLVLLAVAFAVAMQRIGAQSSTTWSQRAPFLGGGVAETHAWQRYHVRYYPMTLLFIAFEMEMMFMYPWAVVYVETGIKALAEMGMFLGILSIGILYGWREGVFRWQ